MAENTVTQQSNQSNRVTVLELLVGSLSRIRNQPWLVVPFVVAGVVLSLVDRLRALDPIPEYTTSGRSTDGLYVRLEFTGYPTGANQHETYVGPLLELEAPYLVWAVGLQAVVCLVFTAAIVLTLSRVLGCDPGAVEWLRVFGYIALLDTVQSIFAGPVLVDTFFISLLFLVLLSVLFVRLFAVPGLLVDGHSIGSAIRQSREKTRGHSWRVFGLVVLFGLTVWLLAAVPYAGPLVSTAVVAPVHGRNRRVSANGSVTLQHQKQQ